MSAADSYGIIIMYTDKPVLLFGHSNFLKQTCQVWLLKAGSKITYLSHCNWRSYKVLILCRTASEPIEICMTSGCNAMYYVTL